MAPHRQRQAQRSLPLAHHQAEVEHAPAIAAQAVGVQFIAVIMQATEPSILDTGATPVPGQNCTPLHSLQSEFTYLP